MNLIFFTGVKKGVERFTYKLFQPIVMISGAAPAIHNSFYSTFDSAKSNIICWAHVKRNVCQKTTNGELLADKDTLQHSSTPEIFSRGTGFFFQKWKKKEKKIL